MSNISASHLSETCTSLLIPSNVGEVNLLKEPAESFICCSSACINSVGQINKKAFKSYNKEQVKTECQNDQCNKSFKDKCQAENKNRETLKKNSGSCEYGKGESLNIQTCIVNQENNVKNKNFQDDKSAKQNFIQQLKNSKLNSKRKLIEAPPKQEKAKCASDLEIEDSENQNSSNKLKVEDTCSQKKLPRKIQKLNDKEKYSDLNTQSSESSDYKSEQTSIDKSSESVDTNQNKKGGQHHKHPANWNQPQSVSSLESQQEDSFQSESSDKEEVLEEEEVEQQLEVSEQAQKLKQVNSKMEQPDSNNNIQNTNFIIQLIEKMKQALMIKMQMMQQIRSEAEEEFSNVSKREEDDEEMKIEKQQNIKLKAQKQVHDLSYYENIIDKAAAEYLQENGNNSNDHKDEEKLLKLIYKMASDVLEGQQKGNKNQIPHTSDQQQQVYSDNESMECREESMSDSVQHRDTTNQGDKSTNLQIQLLKQQQEIVSEESDEDDSVNSQEQSEDDDMDLFISDTEEDHQFINFDSKQYENDYILILDLDNTLVHSYMGGPSILGQGDPSINKIETHVNQQKLYIKRRPYLKEFFETAFKHFKVVMYTLGSLGYARAVYQVFKKEYPEIFSQHSFLKIIAQNTSRTTASQTTTTPTSTTISSPQVTIQKPATLNSTDNSTTTTSPQSSSSSSTQSSSSSSSSQQTSTPTQTTTTTSPSSQNETPIQSLQSMYTTNKFLKNISKYFPPERFSKRLLIFDDNSRVYEQFWWKNAVFTKPYYYWMNNNNAVSLSSDSFLFFASELLKNIIGEITDANPDLPLIYQNIRKNLLGNTRFYITNDNQEKANLIELIKELGGEVVSNLQQQTTDKQGSPFSKKKSSDKTKAKQEATNKQLPETQHKQQSNSEKPHYIILNESQENHQIIQQIAFTHQIKLITSNWIKYCFLLNYRVPCEMFNLSNYLLYQQPLHFPNFETDLVNVYSLSSASFIQDKNQ